MKNSLLIGFVLLMLCVFCGVLGFHNAMQGNSIMDLQNEVAILKEANYKSVTRQINLITYNDCFVCHEEGKRYELINDVVWEWEEE